MTKKTTTQPLSRGKAWLRAMGFTLSVALVLTIGLMMLNAARLPKTAGSTDTGLFGLTFFTSTRSALADGGSSVSLTPGPGVLLIWVLAVACAGVLVWRATERSAHQISRP